MSSSGFSNTQAPPDGELLNCGGSTCDCFRVKLYGKLHFKKQLKVELRTDPRYVAALQKEFETGYQLEHPHLVRYLFRGDDYILTEYIDGETLDVFMAHHPDYFLHRDNADRFLRQLLDVVSYLHQHQVVHLDLKPSNIMITRVGNDVKLVDLGFCYTDTYTDTMGRTDKYAAPEQLNDSNKVDARTDIYAIGKILQLLPCAKRYSKVISRCTANDPEQRYSSVTEIEQQISDRHIVLWPWLLALLILAVIISAFFFIRHNDSKPSFNPDTPQTEAKPATQHVSQTEHQDETEIVTNEGQPVTEPTEAESSETTPEQVEPSPVEVKDIKVATPKPTDINTLRKELKELCQPLFDKQLAVYRDSSYERMGYIRFTRLTSDFKQSVNPLYWQLWEQRYKAIGSISQPDFFLECAENSNRFIDDLYEDMLRNDQTK